MLKTDVKVLLVRLEAQRDPIADLGRTESREGKLPISLKFGVWETRGSQDEIQTSRCQRTEDAVSIMSMLYGELTSPTAISHVLKAQLVSVGEENLIVAKSSLLQIFRIETSVRETQIRHSQPGRKPMGDAVADLMLGEDGGEDFMGDDSQVQLLRHEEVGRLVLVDEIHMSGTITGMANMGVLQSISTETDCIAISFQDAKVDSFSFTTLITGVDIVLGVALPFPFNFVNSSIRTRVL